MSGEVIDMGEMSGDVEEIYTQLVTDLEHQVSSTNTPTINKTTYDAMVLNQ